MYSPLGVEEGISIVGDNSSVPNKAIAGTVISVNSSIGTVATILKASLQI